MVVQISDTGESRWPNRQRVGLEIEWPFGGLGLWRFLPKYPEVSIRLPKGAFLCKHVSL